jgi:hypothetical protein
VTLIWSRLLFHKGHDVKSDAAQRHSANPRAGIPEGGVHPWCLHALYVVLWRNKNVEMRASRRLKGNSVWFIACFALNVLMNPISSKSKLYFIAANSILCCLHVSEKSIYKPIVAYLLR